MKYYFLRTIEGKDYLYEREVKDGVRRDKLVFNMDKIKKVFTYEKISGKKTTR